MTPTHRFSDTERAELQERLLAVAPDPYRELPAFIDDVRELAREPGVLRVLGTICEEIRSDRSAEHRQVHVLRNCPIDADLPLLDLEDPIRDKLARKRTYVSEAFLALFSELTKTPLLAYASRHGGSFFTDVIAIKRLEGKASGFTAEDLVYHNDRTSHPVRADYIALLGMHCPEADLVFTIYVDGVDLVERIPAPLREVLARPYFFTPHDDYSLETRGSSSRSGAHAILEGGRNIRYRDTATRCLTDAPAVAKDALIALKDALATAPKHRHRILPGDLLAMPNQRGLHTRERIEVSDPERAKHRWLQKTYAFRDSASCAAHSSRWCDGVVGLAND